MGIIGGGTKARDIVSVVVIGAFAAHHDLLCFVFIDRIVLKIKMVMIWRGRGELVVFLAWLLRHVFCLCNFLQSVLTGSL